MPFKFIWQIKNELFFNKNQQLAGKRRNPLINCFNYFFKYVLTFGFELDINGLSRRS